MKIEHIVASGCSFTADGIGGVPPSIDNPSGGCSFNMGIDSPAPASWVSEVAKRLNSKSLVNFATHNHGNLLISTTIIEALSKYTCYQNENTMVLFNLTDLGRLDLMCDHNNINKSTFIPWSKELLPFSFLSRRFLHRIGVDKNIGIEQIEIMSEHAIMSLIYFLEQKKFNYRFLTMSQYGTNTRMAKILQKYRKNLIMLPGGSMKDFCLLNNLTISGDDHHPNLVGHTKIAEIVIDNLKQSGVDV